MIVSKRGQFRQKLIIDFLSVILQFEKSAYLNSGIFTLASASFSDQFPRIFREFSWKILTLRSDAVMDNLSHFVKVFNFLANSL
jgi:hypothetical protein